LDYFLFKTMCAYTVIIGPLKLKTRKKTKK